MSINIGKNPVMMKKEEVKAEPKEATKKLETVSDAIDSGEIWRYKMDDKNRSLENDITQLRDVIGNLMSSTLEHRQTSGRYRCAGRVELRRARSPSKASP